jgi:Zn-dependent protease/CBS domain-containing protein
VSQSTTVSDRGRTSGTLFGFRLMGIPIRFHFTFHILAIVLLSNGASNAEYVYPYWLYLIAVFASLLLHEIAHAVAARAFGVKTLEIAMHPLGGQSKLARPLKPLEELCVALSGPLGNVALALSLFSYLNRVHQNPEISLTALLQPTTDSILSKLMVANFLLGSFNLFPALPLDGGRILRAAVALVRPDNGRAARAAAWMGRTLATCLGVYGLLGQQYILALFAVFIYLGAARESSAAENSRMTTGVPVRAAMVREFHKLTHADTLRDAANLMLATSQKDFPVVHGDQVVGLLGRAALLRALARAGPNAYVAGAMDRDFLCLEPGMDLAQVLPLIPSAAPCALVMDGEKLVGLLNTDNFSEFVLLRGYGIEPA